MDDERESDLFLQDLVTNDGSGPMFFTADENIDTALGSIKSVGADLDDSLDGLLVDADLLVEAVHLTDEEDDDNGEERQRRKSAPKFHMRIQPANKSGKRRRGRPTKKEVAARTLANGGVPPIPSTSTPNQRKPRRTVTKRQQLSAKTKSLRRKISSSAWGKVHRERRNASISVMKKAIPGISQKLDTVKQHFTTFKPTPF